MKNKRMIALMWAFAVIPAIALILIYTKLPERIPTNFGFDGSVNAYGPRHTLILLALLPAFLGALLQFLPAVDPRRHSYVKFQKYYDFFAVFMVAFLMLVFLVMITETLRPGTISIGRLVTAMLACMFIVVGNMMGKVKHNYLFGIRTPWTLADPDVWTRTHSLGGKIWFLMGVLLLPACMILPEQVFFWLMMIALLGSTIFIFAISYVFFRQKEKE